MTAPAVAATGAVLIGPRALAADGKSSVLLVQKSASPLSRVLDPLAITAVTVCHPALHAAVLAEKVRLYTVFHCSYAVSPLPIVGIRTIVQIDYDKLNHLNTNLDN